MLIILSPSKTLNDQPLSNIDSTAPLFEDKTHQIAKKLKSLTKPKIKALMDISDALTQLNHQRFQNFNIESGHSEGSLAIHTFKGDVFIGLHSEDWTIDDLTYAENRLFILSGLYGLLKPSTRIQPYRLEMGSKLKVGRKKNLYEFWDTTLTNHLNQVLENHEEKVLVNLASQEYSSALQLDALDAKILQIHFREWRKEKWQFISYNAKKSRGVMARYIIRNRLSNAAEIKGFSEEGYQFNEELSTEWEWFFTK